MNNNNYMLVRNNIVTHIGRAVSLCAHMQPGDKVVEARYPVRVGLKVRLEAPTRRSMAREKARCMGCFNKQHSSEPQYPYYNDRLCDFCLDRQYEDMIDARECERYGD